MGKKEGKRYYKVKWNGEKTVIIRRGGAKVPEWKDLKKCQRVNLQDWTFGVGDSIKILMHNDENDAFAFVCQIGDLKDGRYVMLVLWYSSRAEIKSRGCSNLKAWPTGCSWMLTTHLEVLMWDTANGKMDKAQEKVAQQMVVDVCQSGPAIIYQKNDPFLQWMGLYLPNKRKGIARGVSASKARCAGKKGSKAPPVRRSTRVVPRVDHEETPAADNVPDMEQEEERDTLMFGMNDVTQSDDEMEDSATLERLLRSGSTAITVGTELLRRKIKVNVPALRLACLLFDPEAALNNFSTFLHALHKRYNKAAETLVEFVTPPDTPPELEFADDNDDILSLSSTQQILENYQKAHLDKVLYTHSCYSFFRLHERLTQLHLHRDREAPGGDKTTTASSRAFTMLAASLEGQKPGVEGLRLMVGYGRVVHSARELLGNEVLYVWPSGFLVEEVRCADL
jgi:hypothetical protein